jgi:hypothetical protein
MHSQHRASRPAFSQPMMKSQLARALRMRRALREGSTPESRATVARLLATIAANTSLVAELSEGAQG